MQNRKIFNNFKFFVLIILAVIVVSAVLVLAPSGSKKEVEKVPAIKAGYNLNNKINESDLIFTFDDDTKEATFVGVNPSDGTGECFNLLTLDIPDKVLHNNQYYAVTAIRKQEVAGTTLYSLYGPGNDTAGAGAAHIPTTELASNIAAYGSFITALVVPNSVTYIEPQAFFGMASLEYISLPFLGSTKDDTEGSLHKLFSENGGVTFNGTTPVLLLPRFFYKRGTYSLNNGEVSVENFAQTAGWTIDPGSNKNNLRFYSVPCNLTKVVVTNATQIGIRALYDITSIEEIEINDSCNTILGSSFADLVNLKKIKLPADCYQIHQSALSECKSLTEVRIPKNVTTLSYGLFSVCSNLQKVYLPSGILIIEPLAFQLCNSLEFIYLYNPLTGENVTPERKINLPTGLRKIQSRAFTNCGLIDSIYLPISLEELGEDVFEGCISLNTISAPFIGSERGSTGDEGVVGYWFGTSSTLSATYIATQATGSYVIPTSLKTVSITDEEVVAPDAFKNMTSLTTISLNKNIETIADGSLAGCGSLKYLTIPYVGNGITQDYLGRAFGTKSGPGCNVPVTQGETQYYIPSSLTNLVITNQREIKTGTFDNCQYLESVEIGNATQYINDSAFYLNPRLNTLILPFVGYTRGSYRWAYMWGVDYNRYNALSWIFSGRDHANTTRNTQNYGEYGYIKYIPTSLQNITITDDTFITARSFRYLTTLKSLTIKNNENRLTGIESGAAIGCYNLTDLNLPYCGNVKNVSGANGSNNCIGWIFGMI